MSNSNLVLEHLLLRKKTIDTELQIILDNQEEDLEVTLKKTELTLIKLINIINAIRLWESLNNKPE